MLYNIHVDAQSKIKEKSLKWEFMKEVILKNLSRSTKKKVRNQALDHVIDKEKSKF